MGEVGHNKEGKEFRERGTKSNHGNEDFNREMVSCIYLFTLFNPRKSTSISQIPKSIQGFFRESISNEISAFYSRRTLRERLNYGNNALIETFGR